jgi:Flp pilus assembly protein TadG
VTRIAGAGEGQAIVEFAIIITALFALTIGLVTVALGFYQYNALAAGARYGARWAAVVGGTCVEQPSDQPNSATGDWCNQYGQAIQASGTPALNFWTSKGSYPLQPAGTACPTAYSSSLNYFYKVGDYTNSGGTSIAGAIAQHFDTTSSSYSKVIPGGYLPAFNLSALYLCIQPTSATYSSGTQWVFAPGQTVKVVLYYTFTPVSGLLTTASFNMTAASRYLIQ